MSSSKTATSPRRVLMKSNTLPLALRIRIWAGRYVYLGRNEYGMGNVKRLPFTKIVKLNTTLNEVEAMEYVRKHTSIPVPKVYKVYERPDGTVHILMEFIPSDGADYMAMSPAQIKSYGEQLADYLQQLRSLKPPEAGFIGSVNRKPLVDYRTGQVPFGPFPSVDNFHAYLRLGGPLEGWLYDPVVKTVHGRSGEYCVKFTHADLNPRNIQYRNGRITGIIDWECAGWYPEYWEYTKMWYDERPPYKTFFDAIEGTAAIEKYPEELEAECDIRRRISSWRLESFYDDPKNIAAFYRSIGLEQGQVGESAATNGSRGSATGMGAQTTGNDPAGNTC
ncbi:hypothetical protein V2A60_009605 [Cordyceps javanica]